ncbi:mitotic spindle checkpoint protein MAD2 isoform X1 [Lactuca sativa]|uniref:mitotic spindle checkpoint protein MAD2 isoform X1 n=2 Tax=Lactuca sativa TaxID=4236 RepID=UPI000CD86077|nr:mitotic spindle checkpoint protein MAD2 isoform X1 [Lactuca sativa]
MVQILLDWLRSMIINGERTRNISRWINLVGNSMEDYAMRSPNLETPSKDIITLRESSAIVCELFGYAANSILHLNGVYPEETFERVKKHEHRLFLSKNVGVKLYLSEFNEKISEWLESGRLHKIELLIMTKATNEVLQSWNFSIETHGEIAENILREKSDKEIMNEIGGVLRHISATFTFLPPLNEPCIFHAVAHLDEGVAVPFKWKENVSKSIENPDMETLRAFNTEIHKVGISVSFKKRKSDDQIHEVIDIICR